jgi:hypothetical protein
VPLFRRRHQPVDDPDHVLRKVPDDLPRDDLFEQPLAVSIVARDPEPAVNGARVAFRVVVRDANGRRCPDLNVEATVTGPHRSATGDTTTDLMGAATFRMTGPAGAYRIELVEVAGGALAWEADETTAAVEVS